MPRHAAPNSSRTRRSASAEIAYRARAVTGTIDLTAQPPAVAVRERVMATAARNGAVLGLVASMVWIYDVARVVRG